MSQDEYDVSQYTEEELLSILDMNNPTDRELEAQILRNINMYENGDDAQSKKLLQFYNDIYDRFFKDDTPQETETETPIIPVLPEMKNQFSREYSTTIVIDSQYRNPNTFPNSGSFNLDLSTSVKNVTKIKLDSVTIPYTWYNINDGENSFYIIQTDTNEQYTISVPHGNYDNQSLIEALNLSLNEIANTYTDISFGNTQFIYKTSLNIVEFNVDISRLYQENSYSIQYQPKSTMVGTKSITKSIFEFMGFSRNKYIFTTVTSNKTHLPPLSANTLTTNPLATTPFYTLPLFQLTENNNFFQIAHYVPNEMNIPPVTYVDSSNITILNIYTLSLNLPVNETYSRNTLQVEIQSVLNNNINLINTEFILSRDNVDSAYYTMNVELNRYTTPNMENSKIAIIFPRDSNIINDIWVGRNSAFVFDHSVNELNINTSDNPVQENVYDISSNPQILLICNKEYYTTNQYIITVQNGSYIIDDYIEAINGGISAANISDELENTRAYVDISNKFVLDVEINKVFTESNFTYTLGQFWDISGTFNDSVFTINMDSNNAPYTVTTDNSLCFIIAPKSSTSISSEFRSYIYLSEGSYNSLTELSQALIIALNTPNEIPNFLVAGFVATNQNSLTVDIKIVDNLTTNDFSIEFIDNSNTWENYLYVPENIQIDLTTPASITAQNPLTNPTILVTTNNNKIILYPDNNIVTNTLTIEIIPNNYTLYTLLIELNSKLQIAQTANKQSIASGSGFYIEKVGNSYYTKMYINVNQIYSSNDYTIVFYNVPQGCYSDVTKTYNASLNTLGYTLGYSEILYDLSNYPDTNGVVILSAENQIMLQTNQYFILALDDFTNASKNTSLVTSISPEIKQQLPSYTKEALRRLYVNNDGCESVVSIVKKNNQIMTAKELLASQTILDNLSSENTATQFDSGVFSNQLNQSNVKNILTVIPLYKIVTSVNVYDKVIVYTPPATSIERNFFGPVNISRMSVKLLNSKGNVVNLNGANWSFVLTCTNMY